MYGKGYRAIGIMRCADRRRSQCNSRRYFALNTRRLQSRGCHDAVDPVSSHIGCAAGKESVEDTGCARPTSHARALPVHMRHARFALTAHAVELERPQGH